MRIVLISRCLLHRCPVIYNVFYNYVFEIAFIPWALVIEMGSFLIQHVETLIDLSLHNLILLWVKVGFFFSFLKKKKKKLAQ
jgi:hypothetical protein